MQTPWWPLHRIGRRYPLIRTSFLTRFTLHALVDAIFRNPTLASDTHCLPIAFWKSSPVQSRFFSVAATHAARIVIALSLHLLDLDNSGRVGSLQELHSRLGDACLGTGGDGPLSAVPLGMGEVTGHVFFQGQADNAQNQVSASFVRLLAWLLCRKLAARFQFKQG